jgi:hypothetical protein
MNMSKKTLTFFIVIIALTSFAAAAFGVAVTNSIADSTGVIHGCYKKNNGQLRVVESGTPCLDSEEEISWHQGVPTVAGFVGLDGSIGNQKGFTVTKLSPGVFELRFPTTIFSDHPAVAVSAWGIPGQNPIANVFFNDFNNGSFRAVVVLRAADGVTPIDATFQFVATQIVQ